MNRISRRRAGRYLKEYFHGEVNAQLEGISAPERTGTPLRLWNIAAAVLSIAAVVLVYLGSLSGSYRTIRGGSLASAYIAADEKHQISTGLADTLIATGRYFNHLETKGENR